MKGLFEEVEEAIEYHSKKRYDYLPVALSIPGG
jgi:hypothetical protein